MKQYRTYEQFIDIVENMLNGNWTDAAKLCAESGYYANDLKMTYENDPESCPVDDIWDFVELIEMAAKYR